MAVESVTVHVPHALYARFEERARQTQRSVEEELVEALAEAVSLEQQRWGEHFAWTAAGDYIIGQTAIGRATVAALKLNRPLMVRARRLWVRIRVHPPQDTAGAQEQGDDV